MFVAGVENTWCELESNINHSTTVWKNNCMNVLRCVIKKRAFINGTLFQESIMFAEKLWYCYVLFKTSNKLEKTATKQHSCRPWQRRFEVWCNKINIICHNPSPSQKSKVKRTLSDSILLLYHPQILTVDLDNQDKLI